MALDDTAEGKALTEEGVGSDYASRGRLFLLHRVVITKVSIIAIKLAIR